MYHPTYFALEATSFTFFHLESYTLVAICFNHDNGTTKETFFVSQARVKHKLHYANSGDFLVDEKYIFEVGGKNKSFKQIKDMPNSYIAADDIEVGFGSKIPLWLFGFLY